MNLSEKQKEIVEATENKIVVIASAAAGKSATLTARVEHLIDTGVNPKEIVAITFTNLAAQELRDRVGEKAKDCFIGTIHSYCNYLLCSSGIETKDILKEEQFDKLFLKVKKHPECIKHVAHLLLDEAQDSNAIQFEFLLEMVHPDNFILVGDARQSIYRFANAEPDILLGIAAREDVKTYDLNENYRNCENILDYAKSIIRQNGYSYIDNSIPMRTDKKGIVTSIEYSPRGIARTIKKRGGFKDWFLLCRWNSDIQTLAYACEQFGVPYAIIRKKDFSSNDELQKKLEEDSVKIMTIHQSKGLEAPNVVVVGAEFHGGGRGDREENICVNYVAATRARDLLVWTYTTHYRKDKVRNWESWE